MAGIIFAEEQGAWPGNDVGPVVSEGVLGDAAVEVRIIVAGVLHYLMWRQN